MNAGDNHGLTLSLLTHIEGKDVALYHSHNLWERKLLFIKK